MEKFRMLQNMVMKQHTTLGYGFLALLTAGGEQLFNVVVFSCPCNSWNFTYSVVFLLVPALVLFLLGYYLNSRTWKLFTSCCFHPAKRCSKAIFCRGLKVFSQITMGALVAPVTWISVALLNGTFYECGMSGYSSDFLTQSLCDDSTSCQLNLVKLPCGQTLTSPSNQDEFIFLLRAQSQVLGWGLIATIVVFGLASTCIQRCLSPISFLQLQFWKTYKEKENELLERKSAEHATELAERNLKSFFECVELKEIKTPSRKAWEQISLLYSFSNAEEYYSTIHKYVEKKTEEDIVPSSSSVHLVLDFVDSGAESGRGSADTHILNQNANRS